LQIVENYLNSSIAHTWLGEKIHMRSDYALYTVAIIFFIITGISFAVLSEPERNLSVVATAVLGLLFVGLGYSQRAKPQVKAAEPTLPAPAPTPQPTVTEVVVEEKPVTLAEVAPKLELTQVKGIKEKRAGQLKALGINSVEDLAKASAEDIAAKLKISPKIVGRWIEDARKLLEKS
jgi:predicted flap endonuclease-1-like 5' DNA nuclease